MLGIERDSRSRAVFTVQRQPGSTSLARSAARRSGALVCSSRPISPAMDGHLIQAAVQGGALAFFSAIVTRFKRKRPDIMRELRRQEKLGQPLDASSTILLIRDDARLEAERRRDPRRWHQVGKRIARLRKACAGKRPQKGEARRRVG
jgi:hypothetical protein